MNNGSVRTPRAAYFVLLHEQYFHWEDFIKSYINPVSLIYPIVQMSRWILISGLGLLRACVILNNLTHLFIHYGVCFFDVPAIYIECICEHGFQ